MLGQVFARFIEKSPVSVMVRGMLERAFNLETLDAWYEGVSDKQYPSKRSTSVIPEVKFTPEEV